MSDLLEEYKAYYKTRASKFADNPNYQNSFQAEQALSGAMQSCNTLEEFKDKIGNKNELCAIALVKDESTIEKNFYEKHQESVRKLASERILNKIDEFTNVQDLITFILEIYNKNSIEISMDESHRQLLYDWKLLDDYEIYANAEVPSEYKQEMLQSAEESKQALITNVTDLESNNDSWQSDWKLNPNIALEHRHIRLFPYKEAHIKEQNENYKSIVNR